MNNILGNITPLVVLGMVSFSGSLALLNGKWRKRWLYSALDPRNESPAFVPATLLFLWVICTSILIWVLFHLHDVGL